MKIFYEPHDAGLDQSRHDCVISTFLHSTLRTMLKTIAPCSSLFALFAHTICPSAACGFFYKFQTV